MRRRAERVRRPAREKKPSAQGLGGGGSFFQSDAGGPTGQVVGPAPVRPTRRRWLRSGPRADGSPLHTVLQGSRMAFFYLGVPAVVSFQFQGVALSGP